MKSKIQQLAIFFMIIAVTPCLVVSTVFADSSTTNAIQGDYYIAGGGIGLIAVEGITKLKDIPVVGWLSDSYCWEGRYSFNSDGSGTATSKLFHSQRTGPALTHQVSTFIMQLTWKFEYTATEAGEITLKVDPGSLSSSLVSGKQGSSKPFPADAIPTEGVIHEGAKYITVRTKSHQLINLDSLINIPVGGVDSWNSSIVLVKQQN